MVSDYRDDVGNVVKSQEQVFPKGGYVLFMVASLGILHPQSVIPNALTLGLM